MCLGEGGGRGSGRGRGRSRGRGCGGALEGSEGVQSRCLVQPPRIELGNGTTTVPQGRQTAWRQVQTGVDRRRQAQTDSDGRGLGASDTPSVRPCAACCLAARPPVGSASCCSHYYYDDHDDHFPLVLYMRLPHLACQPVAPVARPVQLGGQAMLASAVLRVQPLYPSTCVPCVCLCACACVLAAPLGAHGTDATLQPVHLRSPSATSVKPRARVP